MCCCRAENFHWTKISPIPAITEIFAGINFRQCGNGRHIFCVIMNTGQKIRGIKISPMQAGGEIGEIFLLAKIFGYTVLIIL